MLAKKQTDRIFWKVVQRLIKDEFLCPQDTLSRLPSIKCLHSFNRKRLWFCPHSKNLTQQAWLNVEINTAWINLLERPLKVQGLNFAGSLQTLRPRVLNLTPLTLNVS